MVVVQVKTWEEDDTQFLYECSSNSTIVDVSDAIIEICDLRSRITALSQFIRSQCNNLPESGLELALPLERILSEAEAYASKDQVMHNKSLQPHILRDHIQSIQREVVAQSRGFPELNLPQNHGVISDSERSELWWAGKQLIKGKTLSDYIGKSEKTKVVIRLKPACQ